jgi:hypothetical protein
MSGKTSGTRPSAAVRVQTRIDTRDRRSRPSEVDRPLDGGLVVDEAEYEACDHEDGNCGEKDLAGSKLAPFSAAELLVLLLGHGRTPVGILPCARRRCPADQFIPSVPSVKLSVSSSIAVGIPDSFRMGGFGDILPPFGNWEGG